MSSELKPCPFCGWPKPVRYGCEVECPRCKALVKSGISVYDAMEKWNNRHICPDSLYEEGESVFDMNPVDGVCCPHCHESFRVEVIPTSEVGIVEFGGVVEECVPAFCPICGEKLPEMKACR